MSGLLESALAYAVNGWHVFPLYEPRRSADGVITCACGKDCGRNIGKHPRITNGVLDATTGEATISEWWRRWPHANIGIACGPSGLVVLDVDPRHEGDESLRDLIEHLGEDSFATRTALTGGGGEHRVFAARPGVGLRPSVGVLGPGLDVRAAESYIVAPPSRHGCDRLYEWEDETAPILPFPQPLVAILGKDEKPRRAPPVGEVIADGQRNATLTSLAGTMRKRGMSDEEICGAIASVNANRCRPPLPESEVAKIAASVSRYAPSTARKPSGSLARVVRLADVQPEAVEWLWFPYIPRGKLTILEGDPGVGKSHVSLAVATHVSLGRGLPGAEISEPANALILSAEDGLEDTVRPRLDAMGADVSRILAVVGPLSFGGDAGEEGLAFVEDQISQNAPALVVLDPLVYYLGGGVDLHRANEVRQVTARLAMIADQYNCAIVAVRHLTKGGRDKAIYRGIGSIDMTAAARSVLLCGQDPDDPSKRAIATTKCNLAPFGPPRGFSLVDGGFAWLPSTDLTAARMLAAEGDGEEGGRRSEAESFLRDALAAGPRPQKDLQSEARECGISKASLRRAKASLRVVARRTGEVGRRGGGAWQWRLPDDLDDHDSLCEQDDRLNRSESTARRGTGEDDHLNGRPTADGAANKCPDCGLGLNPALAIDGRCRSCARHAS